MFRVEVPAGSATRGWRAERLEAHTLRSVSAGRKDRDELLTSERNRAQPSRVDRQLGDPDLALAGPHRVDERDDALRMGETDRDVGVGRAECSDEWRDGVDGQGRQRHQVEMTGNHAGDRVDLGAHRVECSHHLTRRRHEGLAGRGEPRAAADALEQLDAELSFESVDRMRERRLSDEAGGRRGRERALVDHCERVPELVDLHR